MTIYLKVLMNSKFINGCKCQISAIHNNIAKEKITSASPQLALPYLLPILQPLRLHYAISHCNKQVTKKMNEHKKRKKRWFKMCFKCFCFVLFLFSVPDSSSLAMAPTKLGATLTELSFLGTCVPQPCLLKFYWKCICQAC